VGTVGKSLLDMRQHHRLHAPGHPARQRLARRRQVSWLAGQRLWPYLPEPLWDPVARPLWGGWPSGSPLTVCGSSRRLAPGPLVQPERTAFPFTRSRGTIAA
jgi:hypothetical protein